MAELFDMALFSQLTSSHALSEETTRKLGEIIESTPEGSEEHQFRQFMNFTLHAFDELIPWQRGETSRWFKTSDRAHAAADLFCSDFFHDDSSRRFFSIQGKITLDTPICHLMSEAMWRGLPQTARQVGASIEREPQERVDAFAGVFMDIFYRLGDHQTPTSLEFTPWRLLWGACGPRLRESMARPQLWKGFFDSPSGKRSGSCVVTDDLRHLARLSLILDACEEARPLLIDRLSKPEVFSVLIANLAVSDGHHEAQGWDAQRIVDCLNHFSRHLRWEEPQFLAIRQAAEDRKREKWSPNCPRLIAWSEASVLRAQIQSIPQSNQSGEATEPAKRSSASRL